MLNLKVKDIIVFSPENLNETNDYIISLINIAFLFIDDKHSSIIMKCLELFMNVIKSIEESDLINDIIQLKNGHLLVCIKNKKIKELCPKTFNVLKEFDIKSNPINVIQLLDERIVVSCFDVKKTNLRWYSLQIFLAVLK